VDVALKVYDSNLEMVATPGGSVTFQDRTTGEPRSFSGEINLRGETLKFFDIERLLIAG
jgi:hypothetical protein